MPRKLGAVEQDILSLLQKTEPSMLLWREIKARLWPFHKNRYKDEKVFGVALSNYLTKHEDRLWKHQGDFWGTLRSSPPIYGEPRSLWDRLKQKSKQIGGYLVEITVQKASYSGRDPVTGWRQFTYDTEDSIKGIMVLRSALELVAMAQSFKIYIEDKYDGAVLTSNPIRYKDHLQWKGKLYEVRDVEEKTDDFSFRVAKLILGKEEKEPSRARAPSPVDDARSQVRTFLTTHLNDANIARDDGLTEAPYSVIFLDPDYDIIKEEFHASSNPLNGLYAIGEPQSEPLYNGDQTIRDYKEHVPIFIYTITKVGVTGMKLKRRMENELWRVCETHLIGNQLTPYLERRDHTHEQRGSTIVYSTKFVLNYTRPVRKGVT